MTVKPFKAVRPAPIYAKSAAALPYDVVSVEEKKVIAEKNPLSFLRIDLPDSYGEAKKIYDEFLRDKIFIRDDKEKFYIYELTMRGRSQKGFVFCASVEEYLTGSVKPHELTLKDKEDDRVAHIKALSAHTGPIFLAYRKNKKISDLINAVIKKYTPIYDFISDDGIGHKVWAIENEIEEFTELFKTAKEFYVADGHHRNAAAARAAKEKNLSGESAFYLAVAFADSELLILECNRVVKIFDPDLLSKLEKDFIIKPGGEKPSARHEFLLFYGGEKYLLTLKNLDFANIIEALDVSILQNKVLDPIFGIKDPRADRRVEFIGGIRGLREVEEKSEGGAGFALFPTDVEELFAIADAGLIMPPKSTWFEPKLRSGLFIHEF
jgi:uncharacterized protein (DUF1015 family)